MKSTARQVETMFAHCSAISFHSESGDLKRPSIILGFDNHIEGSRAYSALTSWASDHQLVMSVARKKDFINATLIHTDQNEIVNLHGLQFNENEFNRFIKIVPQDRPLLLVHRVNPVTELNLVLQRSESSTLTLIRYIVLHTA